MKSNEMTANGGRMAIGALFLILMAAWPTRSAATTVYPDDYEADNAWTNASTLTPSDWQDHTIHVTNDLDYTAFSAEAGHVYRMETYDPTHSNFDTYMYLYDSSGINELDHNDDIVTTLNLASMITWTNTAATALTWYVRVNSYNTLYTGTYSLAVTDITGLTPDAWEPNNAWTQATAVVSGTVQAHTLHATSDVDFVRFDLIANHVCRLAALNHTPTLDIGIHLYDQTGTNILTTVDDFNEGENETMVWEPTYTGIGYAEVYGLFQHVGAYTLTFDDFGAAVIPVTNAVIPAPIFGSPAIGADGTLYVGGGTSLYAIAANGTTSHVWITQSPLSTPAIGPDGTIYAISSTNLYAFAANGTISHVWAIGETFPPYSAPAIGADGTIYIACIDRVLALNPNGTTDHVWTFGPAWENVYTPPVVGADGTIYVGSVGDGGVYALNPQGGIEGVWYLGADPANPVIPMSPAAIGADGTVYVCASDSNLYALATDGTIAHTWPVGIAFSSPIIGADGTIYVTSASDGNVHGLNPNGTTKHTWNIGSFEISSAPVIGADGTIYAPSSDGHLFALNPNGTVRWAAPGIYAFFASPTIAPNGTLYIPNIDGRLLSIPGTGGLGNTPWPKFNHDIRNTGRSWHRTNKADFDGDGKADPAVFRSTDGGWGLLLSGSSHARLTVAGLGAGFRSVAADYDGDGKNDPAVYLNGTWMIWFSGSSYAMGMLPGFGGSGQTPIVADYDGDGRADLAVYIPQTGTWKILFSGSGYAMGEISGIGGTGQAAIPADFDGDGRADLATFTPQTGTWMILFSGSGYAMGQVSGFGGPGYTAVPADYDGDGKVDPAVYQNGIWTQWLSSESYAQTVRFAGDATSTPVPADYDGDGKADPAVYQQASGIWTILYSGSGYAAVSFNLGGPGYVPAE